MVKKGDQVIIKACFWHEGKDIGERLGTVISTDSYVLVEVHGYNNNPVKCFQNDIEKVNKSLSNMVDNWAYNLFS